MKEQTYEQRTVLRRSVVPCQRVTQHPFFLGKDGIIINAGASDQVLLKGLTIKGSPGSHMGIVASTVGTLIVDHCFISGLAGDGIDFGAPDSQLVILSSKINSHTFSAVFVHNLSGSVSVSMNNVEMVNNNTGLLISPYGTGSVSATVAKSNVKRYQK